MRWPGGRRGEEGGPEEGRERGRGRRSKWKGYGEGESGPKIGG